MIGSLKKSPWVIHYDASSCNGCDIETLACLTPIFDVERLGVVNTGNPKHADIFLVTGAVNAQSSAVVRNIYEQMPEPKVVVAVGACACTGGIFRECYNISGGVDTVIPVDVYVPGCAARPEAIIDGVVQAIAVLEEKQRDVAAIADSLDQTLFVPAEESDLPRIQTLHRISFQREAAVYGLDNLDELTHSLEELRTEFRKGVFLKAIINGKLIGAACGFLREDHAFMGVICVHPLFQRRGIGRNLLHHLEHSFPEARYLETRVAHKSADNLKWLKRRGYQSVRTVQVSPVLSWEYLQKELT